MKRILGVGALALGAMGVALVSAMAPVEAADARIHAYMTGAQEFPGPGDTDAVGRAWITVNDAANTLCLTMSYANVDGTLSGLHLHKAPPGAAASVALPFSTPTCQHSGSFQECVVSSNETLLDDIAANPSAYYINLHSTPNFGPGALRGQLQGV